MVGETRADFGFAVVLGLMGWTMVDRSRAEWIKAGVWFVFDA